MSTENPSTEELDPVDKEINKVCEWITVMCEVVPALSIILITAGAQDGDPELFLPLANEKHSGLAISFCLDGHMTEAQDCWRMALNSLEPQETKQRVCYALVANGESAIRCLRDYLDDHFKSARLH